MKILITGASGQVGYALVQRLASQYALTCPDRAGFDLADEQGMRGAIRRIAPDLLINCAAYTAVDDAEDHPLQAQRINADAPGVMASGLPLRHYLAQRNGCYHLCAAGSTSWHDYARLLLEQAAQRGIGPLAQLRQISSSQRASKARRPANSRLDCSKLERVFGLRLEDWRQDVVACLDRLLPLRQPPLPTG